MSTYASQDVDSPTLLTSVLRYRTASIAIVLLFGLLGAVFTFLFQSQPSATASIGLRDPKGVSLVRSAGASGTDLARYTSERADFARSAAVVGRAAELDGKISEQDLRGRLTTSAGSDADVVGVTVKAATAGRARDLANAVAQAFEDEQQRSINNQLAEVVAALDARSAAVRAELGQVGSGTAAQAQAAALSQTLQTIEASRTEIGIEAASFGSGVEFIDAARAPAARVGKTELVRNTVAGLIFGAFVAMFVAWLRASSSRVIDRSEVAIAMLGLPLLGEIPAYGKGSLARTRLLTNLPTLEYRFVASNVSVRLAKGVLVTAGLNPEDGATTSAINIAAAAAVNGQRVALIDVDIHEAGLTRRLALPNGRGGILDVLDGSRSFEDVALDVEVGGGSSVTVVGTGDTANGRRDMHIGESLWSLLERMRADYDLIVVDASPILALPDTVALAAHADAFMIVVRRGTPSSALDRLHRQIDMLDEHAIGFVFTHSAVAEIPR